MTCEILKGTCLTEWSTWTSSLVPDGGTLTLSFKQLSGRNAYWNAKLLLATTGLHLAQFRQKHRLLAKAVDYAELFIYHQAQQEAE